MTKAVRTLATVGVFVAAWAAAPLAVPAAQPTVAAACPPGETGVIYGCAPFCVPGKVLDTETGLCVQESAPLPAPSTGTAIR